MYDVIVAGGGPAGSSAAYFLGEAGKNVLVLEKEFLPRYKTCGGGLSMRFLREQFPFSFDSIRKTPVTAVSYIHNRQEITIPLAPGAIDLVMRDELDEYLLKMVRAEVMQGNVVCRVHEFPDRVEVETTDGQIYTSRFLIGADGANSVVAHAMGMRPKRTLAAAIEAEYPVSDEVMQRFAGRMVFIFGDIHYGYLWIFPKPNHLTIGIGALHPKPGELQKVLKTVMARYGIEIDKAALRGHPIPIFTRREKVSSLRTFLVGDAAGLADPLSGEGIRFAIKSGRLAAEAILNGQPESYALNLYRSIGWDHSRTTLVSLGFYFFQNPYLILGTPNPFSTQGVVDMLADHQSATGFFMRGFFTLPVFAVTELAARMLKTIGLSHLSENMRTKIYPHDVSAPYPFPLSKSHTSP